MNTKLQTNDLTNDVGLYTDALKDASYESLLQIGLDLRERNDGVRWALGDLSSEMSSRFNRSLFREFCKKMGSGVSTMRRYRDVARAYPKEVRLQFKELSFSHFKEVAAKHNRIELLEQALSEEWSVEKIALMAKPAAIKEGPPVPPKPLMHTCPGCNKWVLDEPQAMCESKGKCMDVNK